MKICFDWELIHIGKEKKMHNNISIETCNKELIIEDVKNINIKLDPEFKAVIYEHPNFGGENVTIFDETNHLYISEIGSIKLKKKQINEYENVIKVCFENNETLLPEGVYEQLEEFNIIPNNENVTYPIRIEVIDNRYFVDEFNSGFEIIEKNAPLISEIVFKSPNDLMQKPLNIYKTTNEISYNNVTFPYTSDIKIIDKNYKLHIIIDYKNKLTLLDDFNNFEKLGIPCSISVEKKIYADEFMQCIGLNLVKNNEIFILFLLFAIMFSVFFLKIFEIHFGEKSEHDLKNHKPK